ncbi:membrane-associated tyrosine- and threonine-specific cdc2-inhibitory kinase [Trichonephila clavipes]|nr:membrane-associated tyrosine- and threonine-specific cdc2-inhibitory kinase [Trichonephila clavipes]
MITGGVKTTPVLAMQLLCDLQPFTNIIEKNAAILFNRLIRLPNNSFWRDYDSDGGHNLKTQKGFIQCVRENIQYKVINDVPFELLSFANPLDYATLYIRLDLVLNVRKRDLSPTALHAIALETINTRFPPEEWLPIYTDGSLLDFAQGAGIGVFSHLFSFYLHAGPLTTHFDGEVEAIHIALQQLAVRLPPIERAVILSDSTSALQALSNYNENNYLCVQNCRELLGKIKGKIVFQWVPSHCGLWGNERADFWQKKGTGIFQNFRRDLTLHSAKLEIKRIFRESFRLTASRVARDKPWSTLCKKSHGIPSSPRAATVAKFRLLTGHDCLCAHLFRFNLVTSPIWVLCDTGQDMTAAHLDECSALNDLNCISDTSDAIEGDPRYLAPELMEGIFTKAADVFSVGITILELASDLDLPRGSETWHQLRNLEIPKTFTRGISYPLFGVISRMMEPDYRKRAPVHEILDMDSVDKVCKKRKRIIKSSDIKNNKLPTQRSGNKSISPDWGSSFSDEVFEKSSSDSFYSFNNSSEKKLSIEEQVALNTSLNLNNSLNNSFDISRPPFGMSTPCSRRYWNSKCSASASPCLSGGRKKELLPDDDDDNNSPKLPKSPCLKLFSANSSDEEEESITNLPPKNLLNVFDALSPSQ